MDEDKANELIKMFQELNESLKEYKSLLTKLQKENENLRKPRLIAGTDTEAANE